MKRSNIYKASIIDDSLMEEMQALRKSVIENAGVDAEYFTLDEDGFYNFGHLIQIEIVTESKNDVGVSNVSISRAVCMTQQLYELGVVPKKDDKVIIYEKEYSVRNIKYYDQNNNLYNGFDNSFICSFDLIPKTGITRNTKM